MHDVEIVKEDLIRAGADKIAARMGWVYECVIKTVEELKAELARRATSELERRIPGLILRDITSPDQVANDFGEWVCTKIREKTGIPLRDIGDIANQEKTRRALIDWADAECRRRLKISGAGGSGLKMTRKAIRARNAQRRFYAVHGDRHKYERVT